MQRLLTVGELAEVLRCSQRTVWRMVKKGLPAHRVSDRLVRFDAAEVEAWLDEERRVRVSEATGGKC